MGSVVQPVPADHPVHYERHRPEHTLLYQLVEEYYPAFKAHLEAQGTALPRYVEQEFEDYLKCGRLEHGFHAVPPCTAPCGRPSVVQISNPADLSAGALRHLSYRASGRFQLHEARLLPELWSAAHG